MDHSIIKIISTNLSTHKGTVKEPVPDLDIDSFGVTGDAHRGDWHRQVSLLGVESYQKFEEECRQKFEFGVFAENITTEGAALNSLQPGDKIRSGSVILEVTQIGKECHGAGCGVFQKVGRCVMPIEGIFTRVIQGGHLAPGDEMTIIPRRYHIEILTVSDRAWRFLHPDTDSLYRESYRDKSGPALKAALEEFAENNRLLFDFSESILPDDSNAIHNLVKEKINLGADAVFVTGGTGVGPKDITPEAIVPLIEKELPGIMEAIRLKYGASNPNALLSRSVAGVTGRTLIYLLPGSERAVREYISEILLTFVHLLKTINGLPTH